MPPTGIPVPDKLRSLRMLLIAARPSCCISVRTVIRSVIWRALVTSVAPAVSTMAPISSATSASINDNPCWPFLSFSIGCFLAVLGDICTNLILAAAKLGYRIPDGYGNEPQIVIDGGCSGKKYGRYRDLTLKVG